MFMPYHRHSQREITFHRRLGFPAWRLSTTPMARPGPATRLQKKGLVGNWVVGVWSVEAFPLWDSGCFSDWNHLNPWIVGPKRYHPNLSGKIWEKRTFLLENMCFHDCFPQETCLDQQNNAAPQATNIQSTPTKNQHSTWKMSLFRKRVSFRVVEHSLSWESQIDSFLLKESFTPSSSLL